jgi:putative spermidine/putrescine transport system permease protein
MRAEARSLAAWAVAALFLSPLAFLGHLALRSGPGRLAGLHEHRPEIPESLALSVTISTIVAAFATAAGFLASREVARSRRRGLLTVVAYTPFAISPVVLGACLLHVFIVLGIAGTLAGVVLAQTTLAFGFAVVYFLGFWTPRMRAIEELARTLGGTDRQALLRALAPCARRMLVVCFAQAFLISWVQYGLTLVVGQGKVRTLPVRVYDLVFEASVGDAAAVGLVLVVPPLLLLALTRRFAAEGT